jgi:hypothetical protein
MGKKARALAMGLAYNGPNLGVLQEETMVKHLILVAGNIGAGKTSLTERLGGRLGWRTAFESVADNPYMADFYSDMRQWSFHLQVFFLGHRARQHLELARCPESAIADRSIYEDAHIFARALYHLGCPGAGAAGADTRARPGDREWHYLRVPISARVLLSGVASDV